MFLFSARVVLITVLSMLFYLFCLFYCLIFPRNPYCVFVISKCFRKISFLLGMRIKILNSNKINLPKNCIYIANHQNNYDIVVISHVIQPRTITIGKRDIFYIPFFGILYWLSGNILIDRNNFPNSFGLLIKKVKNIRNLNVSMLAFPEGTRSNGRGLLPFKTGIFYAAIAAKISIVPICISNISNKIKLNRLFNGFIIIKILPPIETTNYGIDQVRELTKYCQDLMKDSIEEINAKAKKREKVFKEKIKNLNFIKFLVNKLNS